MTGFSVLGIIPHLQDASMQEQIWMFDTLDSTNAEAKRRALSGASNGSVVIANCQTAGRGRMGREFYSPKDTGIYFSMILRPQIPTQEAVQMTAAASVAVCQAVEKVCGLSLSIKWVNDLYLDGKKVCGILTEAVGSVIIVGIGINCNTVFEGELAEIAGSLFVSGDEMRCRLAAELVNRISRLEEDILHQAWLDEYKRRSMILGKKVTVLQEPGSCYLAEAIGDKGELVLLDSKGKKKVLFTGEVSIRPTFGTE